MPVSQVPVQRKPDLSQVFSWSFNWTGQVLFSPFDFTRWLVLAVGAFLMALGGGGGGFNFNYGTGSGPGGGAGGGNMRDEISQAVQWIDAHILWILGGWALLFLLAAGIAILFKWLGGRGSLIFLDQVVTNQPEVVRPWSEYSREGNSLFRFYYLLFLVFWIPFFFLLLGLFFLGLEQARGASSLEEIFVPLIPVFVVSGIVALLFMILIAVVRMFIDDFVVPIMYRRRILFGEAVRLFWGLLTANRWNFFVYFLVRAVVGLAVNFINGFLSVFACCLTCGIMLLPVLNMLPMLPGLVFRRTFSVVYLEQYGPDWEVFHRAPHPQIPADSSYPQPE